MSCRPRRLWSLQEDLDCPLCLEEIDLSDANFKPCPCGYQVRFLQYDTDLAQDILLTQVLLLFFLTFPFLSTRRPKNSAIYCDTLCLPWMVYSHLLFNMLITTIFRTFNFRMASGIVFTASIFLCLFLRNISQICRFCWHHIKQNLNGRCPACRRKYSDNTVEFKAMSQDE